MRKMIVGLVMCVSSTVFCQDNFGDGFNSFVLQTGPQLENGTDEKVYNFKNNVSEIELTVGYVGTVALLWDCYYYTARVFKYGELVNVCLASSYCVDCPEDGDKLQAEVKDLDWTCYYQYGAVR